ncbi:flagellar hook-length control protein FliK [Rheinheimera hassiensis]|uniref:flagellar hook-length control protein FliK n=1 Tax=Rheinheimera hassiensis TaxID=1193627 RepID=UPI001F05630A|nr:flagellar hook-length control protein FliK [Rheinheimera hassiensis]
MTQLQVGVPTANSGSTVTMVSSNYSSANHSADNYSADSAEPGLMSPDAKPYTVSYAKLLAQLSDNTDAALTLQDTHIQPELVAVLADVNATSDVTNVNSMPEIFSIDLTDADAAQVAGALPDVLPVITAETSIGVVADTPIQPEESAEVLINPRLFSAVNILPLPVSTQWRAEAAQQSATGLPAMTDNEYNAALLSSSVYSSVKASADPVLPASPVSLQHFIRQALELARPQSFDSSGVSGIAATQTAVIATTPATTAPESAFQWKADQLGLQSSQWGQKLVHLLSDKINLQLGQHIQRAQIRLDPPQLGLIELSVSIDGDRTTVQLYASNNQMREAMQQNLEQLRQQLAQRMGSEQLLDIDVRQQSQQQSEQQKGAASEHIAAHFTDDVTEVTSTNSAQLTTGWLNRLV